MAGRDKVQSYLVDLGLSFDEVDANTWLITDEDKGLKNIVVLVSEPLVILRVNNSLHYEQFVF